eukprot:3610954-Amphidinium_carterae.1
MAPSALSGASITLQPNTYASCPIYVNVQRPSCWPRYKVQGKGYFGEKRSVASKQKLLVQLLQGFWGTGVLRSLECVTIMYQVHDGGLTDAMRGYIAVLGNPCKESR